MVGVEGKLKEFIKQNEENSDFTNSVADYLTAFVTFIGKKEPERGASGFEEFWKAYPIKRAKAKCLEYWKKLPAWDRVSAIQNIGPYKAHCAATGRQMLDPQGYLNPKNKRFQDEYFSKEEAALWASELMDFFEKKWRPIFNPYEAPKLDAVTLDVHKLKCIYPDVELRHILGVAVYIMTEWPNFKEADLKPAIHPLAVLNANKWVVRVTSAKKFFM
jgi:hypothetical protein